MTKILSTKTIYNGKVINLYFDEVEHDGMLLKREVVRHRGGAAVLAERDGKFAFVRQYRHPFREDFFEIPAGTKDSTEKSEATAYRELQEECGLKADHFTFICDYAVSPGYTDEVLSLFYANNFTDVAQSLDEDESLSVEWVSVEESLQMALTGKIKDGKTLVALLWYNAVRANKVN